MATVVATEAILIISLILAPGARGSATVVPPVLVMLPESSTLSNATDQAAPQASSVRDRLVDAARGTRELSDRAVPGDPEAVKRRGILLDPALKVFPSPEDLRRYPSMRPCADVFARNPGVREVAVTPWTAADAPDLRQALRDNDPSVRALAIEALVTLYDPEDVPRIGRLLGDDAAAPPTLEEAISR